MIKWSGERFADRLQHLPLCRLQRHRSERDRSDFAAVRRFVRDVPLIVVDDAAETALQRHLTETHVASIADGTQWPRYGPPFRRCWLEYAVPSALDDRPNSFVGAALASVDLTKDLNDFDVSPFNPAMFQAIAPAAQNDGARHVMALGIVEGDSSKVTLCGCVLLAVDADGNQVAAGCSVGQSVSPLLFRLLNCRTVPFILAMGLLTARTAEYVHVQAPQGERRKHQQRHGCQPVRYRVLNISGTSKRYISSDRPGDAESGLLPRHKVVGNWAHYSAESPMFGKLSGWFFRTEHERGSAANGTIEKDYKIQLPPRKPRPGEEAA